MTLATANFLRSRRIRKRQRTEHTHFLLKESQAKWMASDKSDIKRVLTREPFFFHVIGSNLFEKKGREGELIV